MSKAAYFWVQISVANLSLKFNLFSTIDPNFGFFWVKALKVFPFPGRVKLNQGICFQLFSTQGLETSFQPKETLKKTEVDF